MWSIFRSAKIDGVIFKLTYRVTILILVAFSFVITCKLVFGYSFSCVGSNNIDYLTQVYCYLQSPFIVASALSKHVGVEVPHPGISISRDPADKLVHTPYYRWVNLFFLVLAVLLYLPHLLWKVCEGGLMERLTAKDNNSFVNESEKKAAVAEIATYILNARGGHLLYTGAYVLSEVINWLVCVLLTIWLVYFFNVEMYFISHEFAIETWDHFFLFNFPIMARCQHHRYGSSGNVQRHDLMCILPLNELYGYMFLFLLAWFIFLCVVSSLVIPYRILGLLIPPIRILLFRLRSQVSDQALLDFANRNLSFGDWFLLTRLQKNLLPQDLSKVLMYVRENFNRNPLDLGMEDLAKLN